MTNVETDRLEEARRAIWLKLQPEYDMTLINDLEAAVRAAVRDQPESDAEVEAVAKCLQVNIGQRYHESWYRDMARFALAAAREAR